MNEHDFYKKMNYEEIKDRDLLERLQVLSL